MGWTIGLPSLKLNNTGSKSKHCGNFYAVAAEALEERLGHDPDINPELSEKNIYMGFESAQALINYSDEHCSTLKDAKGRSLRSDAVRMCSTIIKPPAAYMATLTEEEQKQFLQDALDKLCEIVGRDNVKSVAWHFDEQGAHVHVFWEPMTQDGRLCAKELHNLKFFSRLNKEMPEHLRSCGWNIDDCNAYDQAKEELLTEQEKAERRQKNGRSSAVYKADAQRRLNEINLAIDETVDNLHIKFENEVKKVIDHVVENQNGVYDDVMFLMAACDDDRFEELNQEALELKEELLLEVNASPSDNGLDKFIDHINAGHTLSLTWEQRQKYWDNFREVSNEFWDVRKRLGERYQDSLSDAYNRRADWLQVYYDSMYTLHRTRNIFASLFSLVRICVAMSRENQINKEIQELRQERQKLIDNTATFKRFSNYYREDLKAGKMPFEHHLNAMAKVVENINEQEDLFKEPSKQQERHNLPNRDDNR